MKVYVLIENDYNYDGDGVEVEIIGVFNNKEKAIQARNILIIDDITNYGFIKDEQNKNDNNDIITLFWNYQENWNNYIDLEIIEKEVL